jgi:hypothetical protein
MLITDQVATAPVLTVSKHGIRLLRPLQTGLAQKVQIHESERQRRGI